MGVKVFVLGLPGSGKSTATRSISMLARDRGYTVKAFNDYDILREWFDNAPDGPQFSRADHGAFDVHDLTVFDTSLQELEERILQEVAFSEKELILIEFARADYLHTFKQFSAAFLQDAYFLFIDAEISVCKERVRLRSLNQSSSDDHYVSDYIFDTYYYTGRGFCTASELNEAYDTHQRHYSVNAQRMKVINNGATTPWPVFISEIAYDTAQIIEQENLESLPVETLQEVKDNLFFPAGENKDASLCMRSSELQVF